MNVYAKAQCCLAVSRLCLTTRATCDRESHILPQCSTPLQYYNHFPSICQAQTKGQMKTTQPKADLSPTYRSFLNSAMPARSPRSGQLRNLTGVYLGVVSDLINTNLSNIEDMKKYKIQDSLLH